MTNRKYKNFYNSKFIHDWYVKNKKLYDLIYMSLTMDANDKLSMILIYSDDPDELIFLHGLETIIKWFR